MSDLKLRQDILEELEFVPSVDAADIGVAVENGIVTLTGHVPTYAQKITVEDAVRRIKGVKGLAQEIEGQALWLEPDGGRRNRQTVGPHPRVEHLHPRERSTGQGPEGVGNPERKS